MEGEVVPCSVLDWLIGRVAGEWARTLAKTSSKWVVVELDPREREWHALSPELFETAFTVCLNQAYEMAGGPYLVSRVHFRFELKGKKDALLVEVHFIRSEEPIPKPERIGLKHSGAVSCREPCKKCASMHP